MKTPLVPDSKALLHDSDGWAKGWVSTVIDCKWEVD